MRLRAHFRPRVEGLESKRLLASHPLAAPAVAALVATSPPERFVALNGLLHGTYQNHDGLPDVGNTIDLMGSGHVATLGRTDVTGHLRTLGNIALGHATGTLFLSDPRGTVTLSLKGPDQKGPAGLPDHFRFTATGGTGAFKNIDDTGTAFLIRIPAKSPATGTTPGASAGTDPDHGHFYLLLVSNPPPPTTPTPTA
jgi:hypothetical protein